jgi:hypothetical protein
MTAVQHQHERLSPSANAHSKTRQASLVPVRETGFREREFANTDIGFESAWGPDADRHRKLLISFDPVGSRSGADLQSRRLTECSVASTHGQALRLPRAATKTAIYRSRRL